MMCPLCGEAVGDDAGRCVACGYVLSDAERTDRTSLLPPPQRRPAGPLPTLTAQRAPILVVEQTPIEPYWASLPTSREASSEPRRVLSRRRVDRQANAMVYTAVLAAAAAVVALVPVLIDVRAAVAVASSGRYHLADLFTNNAGAVVTGAIALVVGAALRTRLDRFGVGLAGGAGLALAGFVAFQYGRSRVIEAVVAGEVVGGATTHYELGTWVLLAAGLLGLATAVITVTPVGRDPMWPQTDLVIAVVGAVASLAFALGPLIPVDGADLADNWSTDAAPAAFVIARLALLAALALTGVVGFATRRLWGVGFALGGMSIAAWQWFSSFGQIGDAPAGVGGRNPLAADSVPHAVTTVGFAVALLAAVAALIRSHRVHPA